MDKSFDKLRRKVLQAVDDQRSQAKTAPQGSQYVFAQFVRVQMNKQGMSESALAQAVRLSAEQTHDLLEGLLPDQALTDDLIMRIAQAVGCEANLLRIILRRAYTPTQDTQDASDSA